MTNTGFKHVGFLVRKPHHTQEQFLDHWREVHSALAKQVPGLRGYVINPVDRDRYPDAPVDGFSELWFDSEEAADAAWASPAGLAAFDDVENFVGILGVANVQEIRMV